MARETIYHYESPRLADMLSVLNEKLSSDKFALVHASTVVSRGVTTYFVKYRDAVPLQVQTVPEPDLINLIIGPVTQRVLGEV